MTEKIYCKDYKIRKRVNNRLGEIMNEPFKNMRDTRRKIDFTLPISIFSIWIIYIFKSLIDFGIV